MKKIKFVFAALLMSTVSLFAQKANSFEGTITYTIAASGNDLPKEALMMFDGAETKTYIKGDKRRLDINMAMQNVSSIIDSKTKTYVTMMDIMGQKYLIHSTEADIKKEEAAAGDLKIDYTADTKDIAGYKCKKAIVAVKLENGKEETFNIWVTDEIPYTELKNTYKGLKGFPLEYAMGQGGVKMTFTAKNVSKEKISDTKFELPKAEGYKEMTMDEFKNEMMKFGSQ